MKHLARNRRGVGGRWMTGVVGLCMLGVPAAAEEEAWRTSPYHGVIDGATGKPIPCLCRYRGQDYNLGQKVCLATPNGTVLARCDLQLNNTSWVPTTEACIIS